MDKEGKLHAMEISAEHPTSEILKEILFSLYQRSLLCFINRSAREKEGSLVSIAEEEADYNDLGDWVRRPISGSLH